MQLQKRHDLVPPLVEIVRGYVKHERELFDVSPKNDQRVGARPVSDQKGK